MRLSTAAPAAAPREWGPKSWECPAPALAPHYLCFGRARSLLPGRRVNQGKQKAPGSLWKGLERQECWAARALHVQSVCVTLTVPENEIFTRRLLCPFVSYKCNRVKQVESRDLNRATVTCQLSPLREGYGVLGVFFIPGIFQTGLGKLRNVSVFPWPRWH